MNKKFSTLVASMLLATTVGTGYAQTVYTKATAPTIESVTKVTDGRAYQLSDGFNVLVMQKVEDQGGGYHFELAFIPYYQANIGESLWTVKRVKTNDENGIAFQFVNLAHHYPISYNLSEARDYKGAWEVTKLGYLDAKDNVSSWSWMRSEEGSNLSIAQTPEMYFNTNPTANPDSVMTLAQLPDGKVAAVKYAVKEVPEKVDLLPIKPMVAGPVWLSALDLNSKLQTQEPNKVAFTFAQGVSEGKPNKWVEQEYEAVEAKGKNTLSFGEVKDAEDAYKAAWEVYLDKLEILDAELKALEAQKADGLATAQMLKDEKEKRETLKKQLTDVQIPLEYNRQDLEKVKDQLQAIQIAINTYANISEEAKKELEGLLIDLGKAQQVYDEAWETRREIGIQIVEEQGVLTEKEEAEDDAAVYLKVAQEQEALMISLYGNLPEIIVPVKVLGSAYDENAKNWDAVFNVVGAETQSEKDLCVATFNNFYRAMLSSWDDDKLDSNISDVVIDLMPVCEMFKTTMQQYREAAERVQANALKDVVNQEKIIEDLLLKLDEAETALEEADKAKNNAKTNYENKRAEYIKAEDSIKNLLAWEEDANKRKAEIEAIISDLENQENELQTSLSESLERIKALRQDLKFDKGDIIYHWYRWMMADNNAAAAARTYQGLYAVWERLNTFKTPYWLSLKASDDTYLMVDTAYLYDNKEVAGINHLAFGFAKHDKDFENPNAPLAARDINGRFNFRFLYSL